MALNDLGNIFLFQQFAPDEVGPFYEKMLNDMENLHRQVTAPITNPLMRALNTLKDLVIQAHSGRDPLSATKLLHKAVEGLLEGLNAVPCDHDLMLAYRDCHLLVLKTMQTNHIYGPQWTNKQITK